MRQEERRLSRRNDYRKPVAFELSATRTAQGNDAPPSTGRGLDISSHGLGMETDISLRIGEVIKLLVPLNGFGANLPVFAEVRWVAGSGEGCRAGLRFLV